MQLVVRLKFVLHRGDFCMEIIFPQHYLALHLADDRSLVKAVTFEASNATFTLRIFLVKIVNHALNNCHLLVCLFVDPANIFFGQNVLFVRFFTNVLLQLVHFGVRVC
jgi:hypothetical protein